jgi:ABC-2 type transport system ATP-binding protein
MYSIETIELRRTFRLERAARKEGRGRELVAVDDVSLQVKPGELFGLLGPNGAGKTTLIRILCTLLSPTAGRALVEGFDVVKEIQQVRRLINSVSGGETCGYGILNARENLRLFTELYGIPWKVAKPRVDFMLKVTGLDKYAGIRTNRLSTGLRQRMNFARGFTTDPKVLFLDEPTIGLDVHSALDVRRFIKGWLAEHPDKTVLLTTHYMAEADELCDRIAIIDNGKVQTCAPPNELKKMVQKETALELTLAGRIPVPNEWQQAGGVVKLSSSQNSENQTTHLHILLESAAASGNFIRMVARDGRQLVDLRTIEPTLEDVFLKLTGRSLAEDTTKTGEEPE